MTDATRDRLVGAALQLFAERGFRATTVGDIEEAAGLTRRGRAFYRHFASKDEILDAALRQRLERAAETANYADLLPLGDVRAELTLVARWVLGDVRGSRDLVQLLEREGDKLDARLLAARNKLMDAGHRQLAQWIRRWSRELGSDPADAEGLATILLGAAVSFARVAWSYGRTPLGLTDDRFVDAWVATAMAVLAPGGLPNGGQRS